MSTAAHVSIELSAAGPLLSVVYTSRAIIDFSEIDLALLLADSRSRNEPIELTGLLLYRDGQFMQALEGPERAVRSTLERIAADPRHTDLRTVDEEQIDRRRFGSWAMGYSSISEAGGQPPSWFGSPEALKPPSDSPADDLLAWFRDC